jgi:hypothetical protein
MTQTFSSDIKKLASHCETYPALGKYDDDDDASWTSRRIALFWATFFHPEDKTNRTSGAEKFREKKTILRSRN